MSPRPDLGGGLGSKGKPAQLIRKRVVQQSWYMGYSALRSSPAMQWVRP